MSRIGFSRMAKNREKKARVGGKEAKPTRAT
jgi:hypothetical protein